MLFERVALNGFAITIPTLVAVQAHVNWTPFSNSGISGLAALGIIGAAGSAGSLLANSLGQWLIERGGIRQRFLAAAGIQAILVLMIVAIILFWSITGVGILGLSLLMFTFSVSSPGLSGLARAWWQEIGLSKNLAARGGYLEPTMAAIGNSVGPALAAPLVLLAPWATPVFGLGAVIGLIFLSTMPNPYSKKKKAELAIRPEQAVHKKILQDWWMPFTYSFYHIARALLNSGSTAVLVQSNFQGLIGAANAAPSVGHTVAGAIFANRKNVHSGLRRAVIVGLIGQAVPTLLIAISFWVWPYPNAIVAVLLVVGGGVLIGLLKAPVASAMPPLTSSVRPHDSLGRTASRLANGMIIGGLAGPLIGSLIITLVGPMWLLPASVMALIICGVCAMADNKIANHRREKETEQI